MNDDYDQSAHNLEMLVGLSDDDDNDNDKEY